MSSWDNRDLKSQPLCVPWHFQTDDETWRRDAKQIGDNQYMKEEENHFYKNENCPSGASIFGSASKPIFSSAESLDRRNGVVCWNFDFGDREFRRRALTAPSCVHMKEMEFHEFHKKDGGYDQRYDSKPSPILPAIDCIRDYCDTCAPPCRLCPPCVPCLPPPPPPSCCVPYPNALGEKEWHTIRKCKASPEEADDENESCLYERNIKTCDPCALPQTFCGRQFVIPAASMRPGDIDRYTVDQPPDAEQLPPKYNYKEDEGECNKRETRGPGVYPYPGYVPSTPLSLPDAVPCGYHFNERQSHVYCTSFGGASKTGTKNKEYPKEPDTPARVVCAPFPPDPCSSCSPCYQTSMSPCFSGGPCFPFNSQWAYPGCGPYGFCGPYGPYRPCSPCGLYGSCSPCGPCGPISCPCPC